MRKTKVQIGDRFGRLTVISRIGSNKHRNAIFLCKCICGKEHEVIGQSLRSGATKSCGCLRVETQLSEPGMITYNGLFQDYKINAKKRNLEFALNVDEFIDICTKSCHYCGRKPRLQNEYVLLDGTLSKSGKRVKNISKNIIERAAVYVNGIDRMESDIGYTKENVLPCCIICNRAKHTLNYKDFLNYLNDLVEFCSHKGSIDVA